MQLLLKTIDSFWKTLCSVRLTLFLLILLALSSVFGTLIPQNESAVHFAETLSPALGRLFINLQLFDLYHSFWFRMMIMILSLNLIACSINRLPGTLRQFRHRPNPDRSRPFDNLSPDRDIRVDKDLDQATERVKRVLEGRYKNISFKNTPKGNYFYSDKGKYSLFGVYLVHMSVFFILAGAIVGSMSGFNGYVNILEGESTDTITLRKSSIPRYLGFSLYCDEFNIEFYENGMAKEYRSEITFIEKGEKVYEKSLRVNHPIKFRGITFYQASYGSIPGDSADIRITHKDDGSFTVNRMQKGVRFPLPGGEGEFILAEIRDNFMRMGPAVSILIRPANEEEKQVWIFRDHDEIRKQIPEMFTDYPRFNPSIFEPLVFSLNEIDKKYYTGIQVNKDPGIFLVYAGFILIITGLFITFFTFLKRIWVRVVMENNTVHVQVSGTSNRNPLGMERELDILTNDLRGDLLK